MSFSHVHIYTDGACAENSSSGGWGVLLLHGKVRKELCGGEPDTTSNRMELTAAIKAVEALKRPCKVRLYTDSAYVCDGAKKCIGTSLPYTPAIDADLWERLMKASKPHRIEWKWIRGHSGNAGNERADALAKKGITRLDASQRN